MYVRGVQNINKICFANGINESAADVLFLIRKYFIQSINMSLTNFNLYKINFKCFYTLVYQ